MSAELLKTKSREIAYALVRVAYYVKRQDLRQKLEGLSFEFLENAAIAIADSSNKQLFGEVFKNISAIDALVRLGHSLYEIEPVNATVLIRELDSLSSAMRQFGNIDEQMPDIKSFFSSPENSKAKIPVAMSTVADVLHSQAFANHLESDIHSNGNGNNNGNGINTAIRQSAIINRVRQGNGSGCRLKDLLAEFPDVSERTLRYDLQKLCDQGVILRIGNGGPASYYQLKSQ